MRRREFIAMLGGAAVPVLWHGVARAQAERIRRIGVLTGYIENDTEARRRVGAFRQRLQQLGWTDGRNVNIDYRWAAASRERMQVHAAEVAALKPDVILAVGTPVLQAMQSKSVSSATVFVQIDDPVGAGIVPSLARPGGNVTGFTPFERTVGGKMIEVLKEIAPGVARVGFLMSPESFFHSAMKRVMEAAAPSLGVTVSSAVVRDTVELDRAIKAFAAQPNAALVVPSYTLANVHRGRIIALAAQHRMPAIYPFRHYVADGGLLSYGIDPADQFRDAATYIDRILKGEKPGDLPVQAPTRFELIINLKTAKALGLTVPPTLLARADEVIE